MIGWTAHICLLALAHGKVYFLETFNSSWQERWVHPEDSSVHLGAWALHAGAWYANETEDQGLMTAEDNRYFRLTASFEPFSNEGKTLYIQYTVKYIRAFDPCGGGYIKLGGNLSNLLKFNHETPYNIMFGPDQCGYHRLTHLILQRQGKNIEKKHDLTFKQSELQITRLYRLTLRPNNTARVEVDEKFIYEGSLKKDWELLEPKWIPDRNDRKPEWWHDDAMIDDPSAPTKPDDWVELRHIPDENAKPPPDWDEEIDGEWMQPVIDNPKYRGSWEQHRIYNPQYDGFWEPKKLLNPKFIDDDELYKYTFGWIGFDLWQVHAGSIFDDIIITDDKAEADALVPRWRNLQNHEYYSRAELAMARMRESNKATADHDFDDDISLYKEEGDPEQGEAAPSIDDL